MDEVELCYTPATRLAGMIARKEVSPVEVVDAVLRRIEALEPKLNALVAILRQGERDREKLTAPRWQAGPRTRTREPASRRLLSSSDSPCC
jgi:Asp-tRNA(Asn)/Glu-tRNA(Gln) amidotransferase A subunit family amidase